MKNSYKKLSAVLYGLSFMFVSSFATAQTIDYEWGFATGPSGTSNESTNGICFDVDGNMYVVGTFRGAVDFDPSQDLEVLYAIDGASNSIENSFILKFDSDSTLIWAKQFEGDYNFAKDITYDGNESLYIVGNAGNLTDYDTGTGVSTSGANNGGLYVCKLDTSGALDWVGYGTNGNVLGLDNVVYDQQNDNVIVGGTHVGNDSDLYSGTDANSITVVNNGNIDAIFAIYSSAGSLLNAGSIGGSETDALYDLDVDSNGNIFIAGRFQGTADLDPSANADNHTATGVVDGYLVKLNSTGDFVQSGVFEGTANEQINSIAIDDNDSLYISGSYSSNAQLNNNDWGGALTPIMFTTWGSYDATVFKMDGDFNIGWVKTFGNANSTGAEYVWEMEFKNNTLYTAMCSNSSGVEFDFSANSLALSGSGDYDVFIAIYDELANIHDAVVFGGNDRDFLEAFSVRNDGRIALGGYFQSGTIDLDPTAGVDSYTNQGGGGSSSNRDLFFSQFSFCDVNIDNATADDGATITANESATGTSYQWIDCSDDSPVNGETNQTFTPSESGDYACIITNGCAVDTTDCVSITVATTSLNEFSIENVSIYPNPSSSMISIQGIEKIDRVEITSVTGRAMYVAEQSEKEINIIDYPSGIYFVKIYSEGQVSTKKLIKK